MPLTAGTRPGPYLIEAPLGAGGAPAARASRRVHCGKTQIYVRTQSPVASLQEIYVAPFPGPGPSTTYQKSC
jgi:hypothetical protein